MTLEFAVFLLSITTQVLSAQGDRYKLLITKSTWFYFQSLLKMRTTDCCYELVRRIDFFFKISNTSTLKHCFVAAKFTIAIPKANPGEYFDGLNLLTKLLAPSGETSAKPPKIEVLGSYFKNTV